MKQVSAIEQILDILAQLYPQAGTELHFHSTYELLVAVVLSAQCTDQRVNIVTSQLFAEYPTPQDIAALTVEELEKEIHSVGLYHSKAKNIKALTDRLLENYGGEVPADFEELLKLPGVGRKTANVVRAVGFNLPGLGVDTHVHRVATRLGLTSGKSPEVTEQDLKALIPPVKWGDAHHLFIFHGRRVCKARKPDCMTCALRTLCPMGKEVEG